MLLALKMNPYDSSSDEEEIEISAPSSLQASPVKISTGISIINKSTTSSSSSPPLFILNLLSDDDEENSDKEEESEKEEKDKEKEKEEEEEKEEGVQDFVPKRDKFWTKMCSFMYYTGHCQKEARCNFSHVFMDGMEVPPLPTKINYHNPKPERTRYNCDKKSVICEYYVKGYCMYGSKCKFSHPLPPAMYFASMDFRPFYPEKKTASVDVKVEKVKVNDVKVNDVEKEGVKKLNIVRRSVNTKKE